MPVSVIAFSIADIVFLVTYIMLRRAAFRTSVKWGIVVLLVPFGSLVFAIKHWGEVDKLYLVNLVCSLICGVLVFTQPPLLAMYTRHNPAFAKLAMLINPEAAAAAAEPHPSEKRDESGQPPREVRDLAASEAPAVPAASAAPTAMPVAAVVVDPNAVQRAACVRHGAELNALYQELNTERATLKPGTPAVAAFNAKAARYQQGVQALTAEKAQLDALDHPGAGKRGPVAVQGTVSGGGELARGNSIGAVGALASLQTAVDLGDYAGFVVTLKKCLTDGRQAPGFAQIAAFARSTLQNAPPEQLPTILNNKLAAAHAEFEQTAKQVQAIVNQLPPTVPKPPSGAEVYHYGYHPGAMKPNFNTADIISTRELWKGEYAYIDGVPNVFYRSADCEFNPQTKFFITRRDVPKKKLTDAENQEIVRLYRVVGKDEKIILTVTPELKNAARVSTELATLKAQLAGYAMK